MQDTAESLLAQMGLDVLPRFRKERSTIPFGVSKFDHDILGTGGIVCGILTQIWGPKSAGKSTMTYRLMAMAQRMFPERFVVLLDTEYSFNPEWAEDAGVDLDRLQVIQDNIAEEVYAKLIQYAASGACSLIVLDSLANLISKREATFFGAKGKDDKENEASKSVPGEFAKMTKRFVRDLCRYIDRHDTALVNCNQQTKLIGIMYGDNTDYPGGEAYKHNLQMSLRVRQVGFIEEGPEKEKVGIKIAVKVDKNKLAAQKATDDDSHLVLYFQDGIEKSVSYSLFDDAIRTGLFEVSNNTWFQLLDREGNPVQGRKWQGRDKVRQALLDDAALRELVVGWLK